MSEQIERNSAVKLSSSSGVPSCRAHNPCHISKWLMLVSNSTSSVNNGIWGMTYERFIILQYMLLTWGVSLHYGSLSSRLQRLPLTTRLLQKNRHHSHGREPWMWGECLPSPAEAALTAGPLKHWWIKIKLKKSSRRRGERFSNWDPPRLHKSLS